ncbi:MAG: thioredoxin family protein [Deltaproteobacteria bacterium]|nr:thioredoxin family protein [Deltaproteobacteria bacterium]
MKEGPASVLLRLFTHPACAGCGPVVKSAWELHEAFKGRFELKTISLETKPGLDEAFAQGIKTIPTILLFVEGVEVERIIGAPAAGQLEQTLQKILNP